VPTHWSWIPSEQQWLEILEVAREEPVRNRVMLALAYDSALRREELCPLRTDDLDPAHRTLRVRAETTKRTGWNEWCHTRRRPAC
jgi:integrase/recombinase XerD